MRFTLLSLLVSFFLPIGVSAQAPAGGLVFEITPLDSKITFDVEASVAIVGTFTKWEATLTFPSTDVTTGVLRMKIWADSVETGSGIWTRVAIL